jgi:flagellar biosynthetic protein FliS
LHQRAASLYRRIQVESASPPRVLLEVFRRLVEDVQRARECIAARDIPGKARAVDHALALLGQLDGMLDHAVAPELCRQLAEAYAFCGKQLLLASASLDTGPLANVDVVIGAIRDGFGQLVDRPSTPSP